MLSRWNWLPLMVAGTLICIQPVQAQIKIGFSLPGTGVAAAYGVGMMRTVPILPKSIAGIEAIYLPLDSNSDPTKSAANGRKLVTEDNVDVLVGEGTTPASLPLVDIALEKKTPFIATAASATIVEPLDARRFWSFKIVPNDEVGAAAIAKYIAAQGIKTVAFIGFADAYGQGWYDILKVLLPAAGVKLLDPEYYARTDTSTAAQALKIIATKPDAVLVAGGAAAATIPPRDLRGRGFTGPIFQTHGVAFPSFIDRGGKDVDGTVFAAEPVVVAADLAEDSPFRKPTSEFLARYKEFNNEPGSIFGAHIWDSVQLISLVLPDALKRGKPGTPEFRAALRDGLENVKNVYLNNGLLSNSPKTHVGYDINGAFLVKVEGGAFRLVK